MADRSGENQPQKFWEKIPIPTPLTLWLVAIGIAPAALWGWKGVFLNLGILFLFSLDYARTLRGVNILAQRICPRHFSYGLAQDIEIILRNTGVSRRRMQVRDQTPTGWEPSPILKAVVQGRSSLMLSYRVIPPQRGEYVFGDLNLRIEGPLGLALRPIRLQATEEIKVYPRLQPLRYPDLATYKRVAYHWGLRPTRLRGGGREFESLREYVEGDDPRSIHWKATARLDRPIVQEYQAEKNQIVMVLLDAGRLMSAVSEGKTKLDHALEAAVQLSHTALAGGDQAGILAFADRVITFIPPKGTPEQLQRILAGTLSLKPSLVEPQYEQALLWLRSRVRRRSLVVIFTDLLDEVASENLLEAVALLRPRHLPLCVVIRESEWDELLSRPPSEPQGVYERAVLQELLLQRSRAIGGLMQKGALAMDLPPSKLSMGTLERYLEVKRRGLL
ncbi:MAG: DUF58 domain-containing protein [Syntrophobacterales bacterium]|jgi:uncharacterized protein (DUF58 family)